MSLTSWVTYCFLQPSAVAQAPVVISHQRPASSGCSCSRPALPKASATMRFRRSLAFPPILQRGIIRTTSLAKPVMHPYGRRSPTLDPASRSAIATIYLQAFHHRPGVRLDRADSLCYTVHRGLPQGQQALESPPGFLLMAVRITTRQSTDAGGFSIGRVAA